MKKEMLAVPGEAMSPQPYRIRQVRRETRDTFTVELLPPQETEACAFAPGQFNMVYVFGVGEVPISISGDPARPQTLVHTVRAVGTVTTAMQQYKRGATLGIRGPFGSAWPVGEARGKDVILVAGGIGLAPLRPVLYHLLAHRQDYGKVILLYGTRTPEDVLYRRQLEQWRARFDCDVEITVDRASSAWQGNVGVVTKLLNRIDFDPQETLAMICGPEVMMRFTVNTLQKRGVSTASMFLSMERNMHCAIGFCGHCQFGPLFVCKDGPVLSYERLASWLKVREL